MVLFVCNRTPSEFLAYKQTEEFKQVSATQAQRVAHARATQRGIGIGVRPLCQAPFVRSRLMNNAKKDCADRASRATNYCIVHHTRERDVSPPVRRRYLSPGYDWLRCWKIIGEIENRPKC